MSFATEKQDRDNLAMYEELERKKAALVSQTTVWMNEATALHGSVAADKKAEIVALRDALVADLQVLLT